MSPVKYTSAQARTENPKNKKSANAHNSTKQEQKKSEYKISFNIQNSTEQELKKTEYKTSFNIQNSTEHSDGSAVEPDDDFASTQTLQASVRRQVSREILFHRKVLQLFGSVLSADLQVVDCLRHLWMLGAMLCIAKSKNN
jgi:hypothetical protein